MAADQAADPDVQAFRTAITGLQLEDVAFDEANTALLCDVSTGQPWPIVRLCMASLTQAGNLIKDR